MEQRKRALYRHELNKALIDSNCETKDQVLDFLFGTYDDDYYTEYVVYDTYIDVKQTIWNRLNMIWIYPLFIIAAPFRYVLFGHPGFNRETRFGSFILWLVGK